MTSRQPTPQGISRLLAKAGFERSVSSPSRIKGLRNYSSGYKVRAGQPGIVYVDHAGGFHLSGERVREHLDKYTEALRAAGYAVADDPYHGLIVTAPESTEGE